MSIKIYKAETGKQIKINTSVYKIKDVEDLKKKVEKESGVPIIDQILMTVLGKLLKDCDLKEISQTVEKKEFIVICYDRRYLCATENDIQALIKSETPPIEPEIQLFDGPSLLIDFKLSLKTMSPSDIKPAYLSIFQTLQNHYATILRQSQSDLHLIRILHQTYQTQSLALQVALTNLRSYLPHTLQPMKSFDPSPYLEAVGRLEGHRARRDFNRVRLASHGLDHLLRFHLEEYLAEWVTEARSVRKGLIESIKIRQDGIKQFLKQMETISTLERLWAMNQDENVRLDLELIHLKEKVKSRLSIEDLMESEMDGKEHVELIKSVGLEDRLRLALDRIRLLEKENQILLDQNDQLNLVDKKSRILEKENKSLLDENNQLKIKIQTLTLEKETIQLEKIKVLDEFQAKDKINQQLELEIHTLKEKLETTHQSIHDKLLNHQELEEKFLAVNQTLQHLQEGFNQLLQDETLDLSSALIKVQQRTFETYAQAKQYKKEYKALKGKYNKLCTVYCEKIAFRNFKIGDVVLFLPSRNSTPWAAFNLNSPHYFLNEGISTENKEWVVARIVEIVEHVVNGSNPYGLSDGMTFYLLNVEHWRVHKHKQIRKKQVQEREV